MGERARPPFASSSRDASATLGTEGDPETRLRAPRDQVAGELEKRLEAGRGLLGVEVHSAEDLANLDSSYTAWVDYTREWLLDGSPESNWSTSSLRPAD